MILHKMNGELSAYKIVALLCTVLAIFQNIYDKMSILVIYIIRNLHVNLQ